MCTKESYILKRPLDKFGKIGQKALNLSIKWQLIVIYGLLIGGLTVFSCLLVYSEVSDSNQHQVDVVGKVISQQTASAAGNMLVTGDRLSLTALLNQLVHNPYILEAAIYTIDSRRVGYAKSDDISEKRKGAHYSAPIQYQDVIAGYVNLTLNSQLLTQKPQEVVKGVIILSLLVFGGGLVLLFLYSDMLSNKLFLAERQLAVILPELPLPEGLPKSEVERLSLLIEQQLVEKNKQEAADKAGKVEEVVALLCIRAKNFGRLQQLLAPRDLLNIIRQQQEIAEEAANLYNAELYYSSEGNGYIQFSSKNSDSFAKDAVSCGMLISALSQRSQEQSAAKAQIGIGLCLADQMPEQPESQHPALTDCAEAQALMLASLPEPDGLHILKKQLSWLPENSVGVEVSDHGDDIVLVTEISPEMAALVENQTSTLSAR